MFLGDGEDSLAEAVAALARLKAARAGRAAKREALARIEGVYVDGISSSVAARAHRFAPRRSAAAADRALLRGRPRAARDRDHARLRARAAVSATRGCSTGPAASGASTRSWRPVVEGLDATGWDEVSLLSLSTSDYSRLDELLARLVPELERRKVSLALPSLRPETITSAIVSASSTVTKSGFTLAPEAGTERLRRVIRKDFSDEEIVEGVAKILAGGWQTLKLYFMIGLPTETDEDLDGIAGLIERILALPRQAGRFSLGVSISPFVPKPHTPFQWERQCSIEEFRAKEEYLARRIRSRFVNLSLREPSISVLEGILARGDRRLWPVLRRAYELGCRFDGWRDELRIDLWEQGARRMRARGRARSSRRGRSTSRSRGTPSSCTPRRGSCARSATGRTGGRHRLGIQSQSLQWVLRESVRRLQPLSGADAPADEPIGGSATGLRASAARRLPRSSATACCSRSAAGRGSSRTSR